MIWWLLVGAALVAGMLRLPWWTFLVCPALSIGLGIYGNWALGPNQGLPIGLGIGLIIAVMCIVTWLLGRGLAALASRGRADRGGSPG